MKKIRIALIGTENDHAAPALISLKSQNDIFDLAGQCFVDEDDSQFKNNEAVYEDVPRLSLDELWNAGLDAVVIETNEKISCKYAIMAAEHGLHVQMDKPGSEDHEEFVSMINLFKKTGLVFQPGYMYRYNPAFLKALEIVKSGRIGKIYSVEAQMNALQGDTKRIWLKQFRGGMMFFVGCHMIDLVLRLQGMPSEIIQLNACSGKDDIVSNDIGFAVFKYENGASFVKTTASEPGGFMRRQVVVCGTKGTIEINPLEYNVEGGLCSDMRVLDLETGSAWAARVDAKTYVPFVRLDNMLRSFAEMVAGEKPYDIDLDYEIILHEIVLKDAGY